MLVDGTAVIVNDCRGIEVRRDAGNVLVGGRNDGLS